MTTTVIPDPEAIRPELTQPAAQFAEPLPDGLAEIDIEAVRASQIAVRDAVRAGTLASAHDIAEGGAAVALAECCLAAGLGARVELGASFWETSSRAGTGRGSVSPVTLSGTAPGIQTGLFGEGPGGFVVSGGEDALRALAEHTPVRSIGTVGGDALRIEPAGHETVSATLAELAQAHGALAGLFG